MRASLVEKTALSRSRRPTEERDNSKDRKLSKQMSGEASLASCVDLFLSLSLVSPSVSAPSVCCLSVSCFPPPSPMILDLTLSVTAPPSSVAPKVSRTAAMAMAVQSGMAREPTEVLKVLATSFAPMAKAVRKHVTAPTATTQVNSAGESRGRTSQEDEEEEERAARSRGSSPDGAYEEEAGSPSREDKEEAERETGARGTSEEEEDCPPNSWSDISTESRGKDVRQSTRGKQGKEKRRKGGGSVGTEKIERLDWERLKKRKQGVGERASRDLRSFNIREGEERKRTKRREERRGQTKREGSTTKKEKRRGGKRPIARRSRRTDSVAWRPD